MSDQILLGTRKGTIILDRNGAGWKVGNVGHYGVNVSFVARDPRDGTLWAGLDHGHWGTKLSRSIDGGKTWGDAPQIKYPEDARYIDGYEDAPEGPPQGEEAPKVPKIKHATLGKVWSIAFGGADQPGRIWVGTIPGGLFKSDDGGETWELNRPLWDHESRGGPNLDKQSHWFGGGATVNGDSTPGIHSIVVDPRNSKRVLIGISCAGVIETTDDGKTWVGRNKGSKACFLPNQDAEWGHDPHFVSLSPGDPDHIWQQNHCGVFYSSNGGQQWQEVSKQDEGVHFGFPVAVDENDGRTAWLVPGRSDMQRMTVNAGLFVARTQDGGQSWEQLREGLPQERSHDIVYRHCLDVKGDMLAFGSTTGNLYFSADRGDSWHAISNNFPPIYSVRFAEAGAAKKATKKKKAEKSPVRKGGGAKRKPAPKKKTVKARRVSGGAKAKKAPAKKKAAPKKKATTKKKPVKKAAKRKAPAKKKVAKKTPAKKTVKKKAAPKKKVAKKATKKTTAKKATKKKPAKKAAKKKVPAKKGKAKKAAPKKVKKAAKKKPAPKKKPTKKKAVVKKKPAKKKAAPKKKAAKKKKR